MASTIPEELYVTIQYRKDATEGLLGFASPYTKDDAFKKRKSTQDSWAYGYGATFTIEDDNSVAGEFKEGGTYDAMMLFAAGAYPKIVTNDLVDGFEIAKSVRRCGWGGGGNVVWRIADPRGYELEISSDNFARIVDCTTIVNGIIQGKCCWGRDGSKNILLPEQSDVYQEAAVKTSKIANKISLSEVSFGDTIELLNPGFENKEVVYYGSFKMATSDNVKNMRTLAHAIKDRYLVLRDGKYEAISVPNVALISKKSDGIMSREQFVQDFNASDHKLTLNHSNVIFIALGKCTPKMITVTLDPVDFVYDPAIGFPSIKDGEYYFYSMPLVTEYNGKTYLTKRDQSYHIPGSDIMYQIDKTALLAGNIDYVSTSSGSGYYSRSQLQTITPPAEVLQYSKINIHFDNNTYPVETIGYY